MVWLMSARHKPVVSCRFESWRVGGQSQSGSRDVPAEAAVGLCYDSIPYVVVMATPSDLEDLAVGFTITEAVADFDAIEQVAVSDGPDGLLVDVLLVRDAGIDIARARRRTLEARSSCGLCGVETLKEAVRPIKPVGQGALITHASIQAALAALETGQRFGSATHATHAAAWADERGRVLVLREDVGRHNALDKLIGAALRAGLDPSRAFIVVTSRCSYEMVEKTAAAGVAILVAISAPTSLAIEKAQTAGLTLVAIARADGHAVFTHPARVVGP